MILHSYRGSDCIGHMISHLILSKYERRHIAVICFELQKCLEIFNIIHKIFLKQQVINKSVFNDRYDRFHFFTDHKLLASLLPVLVNHGHRLFQHFNDLALFDRLIEILQYTKVDSFLGIIKFIICTHNNENCAGIIPPDLFHGLNSVDARHLNIHKGNIRAEMLRQLNHISPGFGRFYLTAFLKFLFNDKPQGIDHNPLIIGQHNFIHGLPPLPLKAESKLRPVFPYFFPMNKFQIYH